MATSRFAGAGGYAHTAIATLGFLAVAATVAGFFGSIWWPFDLAADYRFPLMVLLAILAVAYGFGFGRGAAAIFLFAAIVNGVLIVPLWISQQPKPTGETSLRVLTYDVEGEEGDRPEILEWVGSTEADVVFLHQTSQDWGTAVTAAGLPYDVVVSPPGGFDLGTTVLARSGVDASVAGDSRESFVEIVTSLDGESLTLLGVDAEIPASSAEASERLEQFSAVRDRAAAVETRVAVVGDLSASRWSHAFDVLAGDLPLRSSEDGSGYQPTWVALPSFGISVLQRFVGLPLDHVLMSSDLTAVGREVGPDLAPNHRGLVVDIART